MLEDRARPPVGDAALATAGITPVLSSTLAALSCPLSFGLDIAIPARGAVTWNQ